MSLQPESAPLQGGTVLTAGPLPIDLAGRPGLPLCEANATCVIGGVRVPGIVDRGNMWRLFVGAERGDTAAAAAAAGSLSQRRRELARLGIHLSPPSVSCIAPPWSEAMRRVPEAAGGDGGAITIPFALEVCGVTYDDFGWQQAPALPTLPRGAALQYYGRTEIVDLAPAVVAPGAPLVLRLATPLQASLPVASPVMLRFGAVAEAWFIPVLLLTEGGGSSGAPADAAGGGDAPDAATSRPTAEYVLFGEVPVAAPAIGRLALSASVNGQQFSRALPRATSSSSSGGGAEAGEGKVAALKPSPGGVHDVATVLPALHLAYAAPTTINASGGEFVSVGVYSFVASPAAGPVGGGTVVLVHAEHLGGGREYRCRFGDTVVAAQFYAAPAKSGGSLGGGLPAKPPAGGLLGASIPLDASVAASNATAATLLELQSGWAGWRDGAAALHAHLPPRARPSAEEQPRVTIHDLADVAQGTAAHPHVFAQLERIPGAAAAVAAVEEGGQRHVLHESDWKPAARGAKRHGSPTGATPRHGAARGDPMAVPRPWVSSSPGAGPGPVTLRCVAPPAPGGGPGVVPFAVSADHGATWSFDAAAYHSTSVPTFAYYATSRTAATPPFPPSAASQAGAGMVVPAEGGTLLRLPLTLSLRRPDDAARGAAAAARQAVTSVDGSAWLAVAPPREHAWGFRIPAYSLEPRCRIGGARGGVVQIARLDVAAGVVVCVTPPLSEVALALSGSGGAAAPGRAVPVEVSFNGQDFEPAPPPLALNGGGGGGDGSADIAPWLVYAPLPTPSRGWSFTPVAGHVSGGTVVGLMGFHSLATAALRRKGLLLLQAANASYDLWCVFGSSAASSPPGASSTLLSDPFAAPPFMPRTRMVRATVLSRSPDVLGGVAQCVAPPSGALLTQSAAADSARYDFSGAEADAAASGNGDSLRAPDYPMAVDLALLVTYRAPGSSSSADPIVVAELRGGATDEEAPSPTTAGAAAAGRFSYTLPLTVLAASPAVLGNDGGRDVRLAVSGAGGEGSRAYAARFGRVQVRGG